MRLAKFAVLAVLLGAAGAGAYAFAHIDEWALEKFPAGNWQPQGFEFKDVEIQAEDGTRLHGWYLARPEPRGIVLFLHGGAGNLTNSAPALAKLRDEAGVVVAAIDYRGYGKSRGEPTAEGLLQDARAARTWLSQTENQPPGRVILVGQGVGALVAERLASTDGARALIVTSSAGTLENLSRRFGVVGELYQDLGASADKNAEKFEGPRLVREDEPTEEGFLKAASEFLSKLD